MAKNGRPTWFSNKVHWVHSIVIDRCAKFGSLACTEFVSPANLKLPSASRRNNGRAGCSPEAELHAAPHVCTTWDAWETSYICLINSPLHSDSPRNPPFCLTVPSFPPMPADAPPPQRPARCPPSGGFHYHWLAAIRASIILGHCQLATSCSTSTKSELEGREGMR